MDVPLEDVHRGIEYMILVFSFRPHDFVLFCFVFFNSIYKMLCHILFNQDDSC